PIENPRNFRCGLKQIKLLSQIKDRRKKGSHRRKRAAIALAKAHRKVRNQRKDVQHQAARALVNRFGTLDPLDLQILTISAAPDPKPDPEKDGAYLPNGASAKAGLNRSLLDAGSRPIPSLLCCQGGKCRATRGVGGPGHDQPAVQRMWGPRRESARRGLALL